ncbi:MAG: hypothetical protein GWN76_01085, partial [candidate division Zixibacteria bacterium]|nr:hypothetical protein [candidate division Zixibacteria bacterium]NIS44585.1 hypothetical protein [candidate division Zixibacteria bacterium]NIU12643.1 hypothetical protein [candidate division Zixibacteria bacterium]NIU80830.1 hypothetical protein [Candidatus Bathyarchaeota archaeon]NIX54532.1 hypothetical protein [candidate division Zixibacteria bacterium]
DVEDEFLNLSCEVQYRVSKQNWVGINSVFQTDHWEVLLHVDASSSKITYDIRVIVTDSENTSSGWQERDDLIAIDNEERDNILQLSTFSRNLIFILVWFFVLLSGVVCYLWRLERQKQYRKSNDIYAYFIIILIFGIFVSQHMSANTLNIWTLLSAVIYSMVVGVAFYDFFRDRKVIIMPSERAEDGSRRKISEYEYTVSVACAKEKKEYVEKVASLLADKGIRILFGPNKARAMWGYDIISFNDSLMREKTFVYIPFISSDFIRNRILMMELESALARQVE